MATTQINFRISDQGLEILHRLIDHFTTISETGTAATQRSVIERALRHLADKEQIGRGKNRKP